MKLFRLNQSDDSVHDTYTRVIVDITFVTIEHPM